MLLPAVSAQTEMIEVVRITEAMHSPLSDDLTGEDTALWEADQVREALALIAELPPGERYRCFVPGWGIRAHGDKELLFEIAFCFHCQGARLRGPGVPPEEQGIQSFDPESIPGRALLALFRTTVPS
ncbi:hypothetical protein ACIP9H_35225 [Streptomyces sp. NPDC088732]|uniref:hypothetical protein n=1 Tax=Streptomyces sp. NPDC088732 TaxID=3365879 RepID=UPI00382B33D3